MSDCDPEGRIFLFVPHTHYRFFFLHTFHFWKWVFDNAVTSFADVCHIVMTIPWRLVTSLRSVTSTLTMAYRDVLYNQCITNTWKFSIFSLFKEADNAVWDKICWHRCNLRKSLFGMQECLLFVLLCCCSLWGIFIILSVCCIIVVVGYRWRFLSDIVITSMGKRELVGLFFFDMNVICRSLFARPLGAICSMIVTLPGHLLCCVPAITVNFKNIESPFICYTYNKSIWSTICTFK